MPAYYPSIPDGATTEWGVRDRTGWVVPWGEDEDAARTHAAETGGRLTHRLLAPDGRQVPCSPFHCDEHYAQRSDFLRRLRDWVETGIWAELGHFRRQPTIAFVEPILITPGMTDDRHHPAALTASFRTVTMTRWKAFMRTPPPVQDRRWWWVGVDDNGRMIGSARYHWVP